MQIFNMDFHNMFVSYIISNVWLSYVVYIYTAISPTSLHYNETISTLRYAQRAKCIVNQPEINEVSSI